MEIAENYLNVEQQFVIDESVSDYTYHEYHPIIGTELNGINSEIRVVIQNEDVWSHPHRSMICVMGQLTTIGDAEYEATGQASDDPITLVNNFFPYLFSNIKYHIGDKLVDEINYPGYATTMKGLLTYKEHQNSIENFGWIADKNVGGAKDSENGGFQERRFFYNVIPKNKGTFALLVPLRHLMGFFEDYTKIIYGAKQVLTFMRTHNNDAIFKANNKPGAGNAVVAIDDGKIMLHHMYLMMPHVQPSDVQKSRLFSSIDRGIRVPLAFRHWSFEMTDMPQSKEFAWRVTTTDSTEKPRYIIVAFQTDKRNKQNQNSAIFDNCLVSEVHAFMNSKRYPYLENSVSFENGHFCKFFETCAQFKRDYYGNDELLFNTWEYSKIYPLIVIDCTKQSERLKTGVIDLRLQFKFDKNVPANTKAYALIISDRLMDLQLGRNKVEVIY
jgi:hypothetical protein